jgi:hypothetical protein
MEAAPLISVMLVTVASVIVTDFVALMLEFALDTALTTRLPVLVAVATPELVMEPVADKGFELSIDHVTDLLDASAGVKTAVNVVAWPTNAAAAPEMSIPESATTPVWTSNE